MRHLTPAQTRAALEDHGLTRPRGVGFALSDTAHDTLYDWHAHPYHQLAYAADGALWIETARGRHILTAGRAAWIPAGLRHRTLIGKVNGASLYFRSSVVGDAGDRLRIVVAPPVMREMILYALRWPMRVSEKDPVAQSFFATMALMCRDWLARELPLFLPTARHAGLARAMDQAIAAPGAATQTRAIAAARLSERTFRRLFAQETGMTWQSWVGQLRLLHAMGGLVAGGRVTDVAADAGYASLSAFAKAFRQITGESPARFRARHRGV